jgi:6-pyruvoyltetrahydropterin/6-carboxytetrahydropterin synthase
MHELSKQFWFEAAHTLQREVDAAPSRRIHGHSYRAVVTIAGQPDAMTGMVMDMARLDQALGLARAELDHVMLDDVQGLGPATLENLSRWIWQRLAPALPGLARVAVHRDSSGETCTYYETSDIAAPAAGRAT